MGPTPDLSDARLGRKCRRVPWVGITSQLSSSDWMLAGQLVVRNLGGQLFRAGQTATPNLVTDIQQNLKLIRISAFNSDMPWPRLHAVSWVVTKVGSILR